MCCAIACLGDSGLRCDQNIKHKHWRGFSRISASNAAPVLVFMRAAFDLFSSAAIVGGQVCMPQWHNLIPFAPVCAFLEMTQEFQ